MQFDKLTIKSRELVQAAHDIALRKNNQALGQAFKPEFLNRIDETIIFHALGIGHIKTIAGIQIEDLNKRLAPKGLTIILNEEAKAFIAKEGYDPVFGARPLKRVIQQQIENPLSMALLEGSAGEGETVTFTVDSVGKSLDLVVART